MHQKKARHAEMGKAHSKLRPLICQTYVLFQQLSSTGCLLELAVLRKKSVWPFNSCTGTILFRYLLKILRKIDTELSGDLGKYLASQIS